MAEHIADPQSYGIYIVDRRHIGLEESVKQLANHMFDFTRLNRRQRIIQRNRTERLSDLLDWRNLGVVREFLRVSQIWFPQLTIHNHSQLRVEPTFVFLSPQYYRQSRMKALKLVYPEMQEKVDQHGGSGKMSYPRPISEPPSPSSSRATSPGPSDDEVDSEEELQELRTNGRWDGILLDK